MNCFYNRLSPSGKKSLTHSMRNLTHGFLESYNWNANASYNHTEDLINDLYFYWLRNSADKKYFWCKNLDENVFSEQFASEMKNILRFIHKRIVFQYKKKHKNFLHL